RFSTEKNGDTPRTHRQRSPSRLGGISTPNELTLNVVLKEDVFFFHLFGEPFQDIPHGHHTHQFLPFHDGNVPAFRGFHLLKAAFGGLADGDGRHVFGHNLRNEGFLGIEVLGHYPVQEIPFRKDSHQLFTLHDENTANQELGHFFGSLQNGGCRR